MEPLKYRKKPVVIEAMRYETLDIWRATTAQPWHQVVCDRQDIAAIVHVIHVHTLEGWHEVTPGDYIIRGVKGEFYPCKPDIFALTYEAVDDKQRLVDQVVHGVTEPRGGEWEERVFNLFDKDVAARITAWYGEDATPYIPEQIERAIASATNADHTITLRRWTRLPANAFRTPA